MADHLSPGANFYAADKRHDTSMNPLKNHFIFRETLLVGILVLIAVAFSALTHAYSQAYDRRRSALGSEWFASGTRELLNHHYPAAVEDFRTALLYDPQNWDYRLRLADALTEAGQTAQALNYYQGLWQARPGDGPVNLQLARLSRQNGDLGPSERYFNGAIFGDWPDNAAGNRRTASLELIQFYLDRGDTGHAESQLIILSENLPDDPGLHLQVADLFARVGDDARAFKQFQRAEQLDPDSPKAIQGAGEAAFRLGDFHTAQAYLLHSERLGDSNPSAKNLLAILQSIFLLDPYERGLPEAQKIQRTLRTFEIVGIRLSSCAASSDSSISTSIVPRFERWKQLKTMANPRFLAQHPEEVETLLEFSSSSENLAQERCGPLSPEDSAILAISRHRELEDR